MSPVRRNPRRACKKTVAVEASSSDEGSRSSHVSSDFESTSKPNTAQLITKRTKGKVELAVTDSEESKKNQTRVPSVTRKRTRAVPSFKQPVEPNTDAASVKRKAAARTSSTKRKKKQTDSDVEDYEEIDNESSGDSSSDNDDGDDTYEPNIDNSTSNNDEDENITPAERIEVTEESEDIVSKRKTASVSKKAAKKKPSATESATGHPPTIEPDNQTDAEFLAKLSDAQKKQLDKMFTMFDKNDNGRFALSDLMRVADEHGMEYSFEEAQYMMHFWDSSGTRTISRAAFARIAIESKFCKLAE